MIHQGLAALEKWDTIEYAAGYLARLAAIPDSEIAHHCWRYGWEDADTEAFPANYASSRASPPRCKDIASCTGTCLLGDYLHKWTVDMRVGGEIVIQIVASNVIFVVIKTAQHFRA